MDLLRSMNRPEQIAVTEHARQRLVERGISVADIICCIANGEIIEQYEQDRPFPSVLVLGAAVSGKFIHAVVSNDDEFIYLITAYYPDADTWNHDFKTRKERSQ